MINTILVADDNTLDNAILRNFLYPERYNIVSALNGREALDFLEGRNIDLILLDTEMPVMDGCEFMKQYSKTPYFGIIPVIVLTEPGQDHENEALSLFADYEIFDYVSKPLEQLNKGIFYNKIKTAIKHRKAMRELTMLKAKPHSGQ